MKKKLKTREEKVCLVSNGLYEGIPLACALALAHSGYQIAIIHKKCTRRPENQIRLLQKKIMRLFEKWDKRISFYRADVWQRKEAREVVSQIGKQQGQIDVLINGEGAKAYPHRKLTEFQDQDWEMAIDVELKGALNLILECYPALKKSGSGNIFNFTNHRKCWDNNLLFTGGIPALKDSWPFLIAKDARGTLNENLALNLHADGISCNNIELGGAQPLKLEKLVTQIETSSEDFEDLTAYGVAKVIAFLCSPMGKLIKGSDIRMPGEMVVYDCASGEK